MAASSQSESGQNEIWWSSWLTSAKEKSMSALSATKRDLAEFVSVLGNDTKTAVEGASVNITKILHSSASPEESTDNNSKQQRVPPVVDVPAQAPYDRCQAELFAVQNNMDTYLQEPSSEAGENYEEWKSNFDIQSYQSNISNLLVSYSHIRMKHSQLVPAKVSYETFWMRYFFRIHQLEKEEKKRADLMARASNRSQDQLQWDEEVEEVTSNPLLLKAEFALHQRSESSTDSFVCVSEETGGEEAIRSRSMVDTESWEHVGSEPGGSGSQDYESRTSEIGEEDVKERLDKLLQKEPSPLQSMDAELDGEQEGGKKEADSNSSDWEDWDD